MSTRCAQSRQRRRAPRRRRSRRRSGRRAGSTRRSLPPRPASVVGPAPFRRRARRRAAGTRSDRPRWSAPAATQSTPVSRCSAPGRTRGKRRRGPRFGPRHPRRRGRTRRAVAALRSLTASNARPQAGGAQLAGPDAPLPLGRTGPGRLPRRGASVRTAGRRRSPPWRMRRGAARGPLESDLRGHGACSRTTLRVKAFDTASPVTTAGSQPTFAVPEARITHAAITTVTTQGTRSPQDSVITSRKTPLCVSIRYGLGGGLAHPLLHEPPAYLRHPLAVEVLVEVDHASPPKAHDVRPLVRVGLSVPCLSPVLPLHHYRCIPGPTPHRHFLDLEV